VIALRQHTTPFYPRPTAALTAGVIHGARHNGINALMARFTQLYHDDFASIEIDFWHCVHLQGITKHAFLMLAPEVLRHSTAVHAWKAGIRVLPCGKLQRLGVKHVAQNEALH
jgi:hypothetical protein